MADFPRPILLFDGECGLCDRTVRWLIRHDGGRLHYAPLQSAVGRQALADTRFAGDLTSVVLIDDLGAHQRSEAAWRVARLLPWPWRLGAALRVLPRPARDTLYRLIARNRLRLFGRADACILPGSLPPAQQRRILA